MKSSFEFDGQHLRIRLAVEDANERAVARLLESFTAASVSVDYGRSDYGYSSYSDRDKDPLAVEITLVKPPEKEPEF